MTERAWLMLLMSMPAQPSTQRVYVWRKLKAAGVLYLQKSVCLLPDAPAHRETLDQIHSDIETRAGEATISTIRFENPDEEAALIARFQALAAEEYGEFLGQCRDFHLELEKERADKHFTFAELEENEAELEKLRKWLPKIEARDHFPSEAMNQAREELEACRLNFERYTSEVSDREVPES